MSPRSRTFSGGRRYPAADQDRIKRYHHKEKERRRRRRRYHRRLLPESSSADDDSATSYFTQDYYSGLNKKRKREVHREVSSSDDEQDYPCSVMQTVIRDLGRIEFTDRHLRAIKQTPFWFLVESVLHADDDFLLDATNKHDDDIRLIVKRFDSNNMGFRIGDRLIKIDSRDLVLVFGVRDGTVEINVTKDFKVTPWMKRCLPELLKHQGNRSHTPPNSAYIFDQMSFFATLDDNIYAQDVARLLHCYMLFSLFMPNGNSSIPWSLCELLEDFAAICNFDWSTLIVDRIIQNIVQTRGPKAAGCLMLLPYFLCEHVSIIREREEHAFPRFMKWDLDRLHRRLHKVDLDACDKMEIKGVLKPTHNERNLFRALVDECLAEGGPQSTASPKEPTKQSAVVSEDTPIADVGDTQEPNQTESNTMFDIPSSSRGTEPRLNNVLTEENKNSSVADVPLNDVPATDLPDNEPICNPTKINESLELKVQKLQADFDAQSVLLDLEKQKTRSLEEELSRKEKLITDLNNSLESQKQNWLDEKRKMIEDQDKRIVSELANPITTQVSQGAEEHRLSKTVDEVPGYSTDRIHDTVPSECSDSSGPVRMRPIPVFTQQDETGTADSNNKGKEKIPPKVYPHGTVADKKRARNSGCRLCRELSPVSRSTPPAMERLDRGMQSNDESTIWKSPREPFSHVTASDAPSVLHNEPITGNVVDAWGELLLKNLGKGKMRCKFIFSSCIFDCLSKNGNSESIRCTIDNQIPSAVKCKVLLMPIQIPAIPGTGVATDIQWALLKYNLKSDTWTFCNPLALKAGMADPYCEKACELIEYMESKIRKELLSIHKETPLTRPGRVKKAPTIQSSMPKENHGGLDAGVLICHIIEKYLNNWSISSIPRTPEGVYYPKTAGSYRKKMIESFCSQKTCSN